MKRGYGVENVLRMLCKNEGYRETHNALLDVLDELKIMQLLGYEIRGYDIAIISDKKTSTKRLHERENVIKKEIISRIFRERRNEILEQLYNNNIFLYCLYIEKDL